MNRPVPIPLSDDELTGRDRLTSNVVSGWLSHSVVILAGLIVPRLISDLQGAETLGIWDFGWATVKYLALANIGVAAAMGRYVALYRASGDLAALGRTVSTVVVWQTAISVVVLAVIALLVILLPGLLSESLLPRLTTIRWVIGLLSLALVIQMAMGPARGVLTGHHRWGLNNAINAFCDIAGAAGMIAVLYMGGGLRELAIAHLAAIIVAEFARGAAALALIADIEFKISDAKWSSAKELILFGAKSSLMTIPSLFVTQTTNIILAAVAGPVVLAMFARPVSLVSQIGVIVSKYSLVLTPMAGSIIGLGRIEELSTMLVRSARTALIISGPLLAVIAVDGDLILRYWMGEEYSSSVVPLILAVGFLLPSAMTAALTILAGLNAHGKVSFFSLATTAGAFLIMWGFVSSVLGWSPTSAALIVSICKTVGPGITVMVVACRRLEVPIRKFVLEALAGPLLLFLLVSLLLWTPRYVGLFGDLYDALLGFAIAAIGYLIVVWNVFLQDEQRKRIRSKVIPHRRTTV